MENNNFRAALLVASSNCGIPTILVLFIKNRSVGDMMYDAGCKDEYDDSGDTARQTEEVREGGKSELDTTSSGILVPAK